MSCISFWPNQTKHKNMSSDKLVTSTSSNNNSNNVTDTRSSSASRSEEENPSSLLSSSRLSSRLREFKYAELKYGTSNFHPQNVLGAGGFGFVYKGVIMTKKLPSSKSSSASAGGGSGSDYQRLEVAIKMLNKNSLQGHKEWLAEVHFLGLVDNPFLVKLIGYCAEDGPTESHRLLVYEYMPNRGLDSHLFRGAPPILPWQARVKIALGAARGLAYLHEEMDIQVIYRDFKTSNVLLDDEFNPKLTDFGLARQGPDMDATHVTTEVKGTVGYAAPEYVRTGHLTLKSDVWSFGVVMFEILTGRKAQDRNRPRAERKLIDWVKPFISEVKSIHHIMDPQLDGKYPHKAAFKFASIAAECLVQYSKARPKMSEVVQGLEKVMEMTFLWEMPITTPPSPLRGTTRVSMTNRTMASNAVPQLISRHATKPSIQTPTSPLNANPAITSRHVTPPSIQTPMSPSNANPPITSRHVTPPSIQTPMSPVNANPPITSGHVTQPSIQTPISPFRITTHPTTSLKDINPNPPLPLDASSKKKMQPTSTANGPTEPFTLRNHRFSVRLPKMPWSS
ncbi:unnamed protein product [Sphagnum troendelagicum]|uniref:Protein kinase domain-containing protein n=1 Tax=Sphagnum troendelagicum TaxID=128251 RepID=A0ABP0UGN0_9BRYO